MRVSGQIQLVAVLAAVVVTVIVGDVVIGVPVAVTEDWLNRQVAPEGNPEQERVMVPLYPVEVLTDTDVDPTAQARGRSLQIDLTALQRRIRG